MTSDELQEQLNDVAHRTISASDAHENIWGEPFDGQTVPISANQKIFVIVNVFYDWHRFEDNRGAALSINLAREIAAKEAREYNLPVIEDAKQSSDMDANHIWIQVFPQLDSTLPKS
jgi:hypothetical protein